MITAAATRLGYRGLALITFGAMFNLIGLSILTDPGEPQAALFHTTLPVPVRVGLWLGAGLTASVVAWVKRPVAQQFGYAVLVAPPAERAASYLWAFLIDTRWSDLLAHWGDALAVGRLQGMTIWVMVAGAVLLFASWPEPTTRSGRGDL